MSIALGEWLSMCRYGDQTSGCVSASDMMVYGLLAFLVIFAIIVMFKPKNQEQE